MTLHLKCVDCEAEITGDIWTLVGKDWQVIGAKAYCSKHRKERK